MTSTEDDADVKIVDFGFAARTDGSSLSEQCGTPGYIAPEILLNKLHGECFARMFSVLLGLRVLIFPSSIFA
jgi:serine/threonine protein kinase